jgi:hypothetical protein
LLVAHLQPGDSYALVLTLLFASVSGAGVAFLVGRDLADRTFAVLEIVIGQLYLVTVVAILVSADAPAVLRLLDKLTCFPRRATTEGRTRCREASPTSS